MKEPYILDLENHPLFVLIGLDYKETVYLGFGKSPGHKFLLV
jgi:hypothetical protein